MSKSSCVTSILTCKENFIINLFKYIVCCAITFLYYKRNRKTCLVRLWCDNALGKIDSYLSTLRSTWSLSSSDRVCNCILQSQNMFKVKRYQWGLLYLRAVFSASVKKKKSARISFYTFCNISYIVQQNT